MRPIPMIGATVCQFCVVTIDTEGNVIHEAACVGNEVVRLHALVLRLGEALERIAAWSETVAFRSDVGMKVAGEAHAILADPAYRAVKERR